MMRNAPGPIIRSCAHRPAHGRVVPGYLTVFDGRVSSLACGRCNGRLAQPDDRVLGPEGPGDAGLHGGTYGGCQVFRDPVRAWTQRSHFRVRRLLHLHELCPGWAGAAGRRTGDARLVGRGQGNCPDLRGSGDYSASCGGTTNHGISAANRFRPLKREQLQVKGSVCLRLVHMLASRPNPGTEGCEDARGAHR